ncbi:hypothetical protein [Zhaonella formicivorans]|uniref:hypothetical protein n=1 Tax=Zhaonella formicivorans TaxID=2528593 RepID=UPI0010E27CF5|nr:hypothetical protein [Zhaonella formicivorans]
MQYLGPEVYAHWSGIYRFTARVAIPLNLVRSHERRVKPKEQEKVSPDTKGISFFQAAEHKRKESLTRESMTYAPKGDTTYEVCGVFLMTGWY